mmetsp:Transcript_81201/g.220025  ORF Transcript_81201/g.220025 Transcript_81201/m.220025 type:complete len:216 (-) Transcript_81201:71-718(-)
MQQFRNVHQGVDDVSGEDRGWVVSKAVGEHHGVSRAANEEVRVVGERAVKASRCLGAGAEHVNGRAVLGEERVAHLQLIRVCVLHAPCHVCCNAVLCGRHHLPDAGLDHSHVRMCIHVAMKPRPDVGIFDLACGVHAQEGIPHLNVGHALRPSCAYHHGVGREAGAPVRSVDLRAGARASAEQRGDRSENHTKQRKSGARPPRHGLGPMGVHRPH